MPEFFVNAPPTKAEVVPEGFAPSRGPGYLTWTETAEDAMRVVNAYRRGARYALDLVRVIRPDERFPR